MRRLHIAIVTMLVTGSLLAATAILHPTIAEAAAGPAGAGGGTVNEGWRAPAGPLEPSAGFDPPPEPWLSGHRGVDLDAAAGREVVAAGSGTVVFADVLAGRGVVSIDHPGGLRTTYEPVAPAVKPGESVSAGQVIGLLEPGHGSCAGRSCLHLGLKRGPLYLDPMLLFGSGLVRLLPR